MIDILSEHLEDIPEVGALTMLVASLRTLSVKSYLSKSNSLCVSRFVDDSVDD